MGYRTILLMILMLILFGLKIYEIMEIDMKYLIITSIILIVLLYKNNDFEPMGNTSETMNTLSNEAIQNLASIYNSDTLTVTNLNVTGGLKVGNSVYMSGNNTSQDVVQIYANGNGQAPYVYVDKTGTIGLYNGTSNVYQLNGTSTQLPTTTVTGDMTVNNDLTLNGALKANNVDATTVNATADITTPLLKMDSWKVYASTGGYNWGGKNGSSGSIFRIDSPSKAQFEIDGTGLYGSTSFWGNKGFF